jgi:hypothetical protein
MKITKSQLREMIRDIIKEVDIKKNKWKPVSKSDLSYYDDEIFNLVNTAYSSIGGHVNIKSKNDLNDEGDYFDVIDIDDDPDIDATTISKRKPAGKKFVAIGHDGSSSAKSNALKHQIDKLKSSGDYVEVSGKMKDILIGKGLKPIKDEKIVRKVLGKEIKWNGDGSYDRKIGGTIHTKMMFGKPKI